MNIRRYHWILFGLWLSASAQAAWEPTHYWLGAIAYSDPQYVSRKGDRVRMMELVDYAVPKTTKQGERYKSLIVITEMDCKLQRVRELAYQFVRPMARGEGSLQLPVQDAQLRQFVSFASVNFDAIYKNHRSFIAVSTPSSTPRAPAPETSSLLGSVFSSSATPIDPKTPLKLPSSSPFGESFTMESPSGSLADAARRKSVTSSMAAKSPSWEMPSDVQADAINAELAAAGWGTEKEFMNHRLREQACPSIQPIDSAESMPQSGSR